MSFLPLDQQRQSTKGNIAVASLHWSN